MQLFNDHINRVRGHTVAKNHFLSFFTRLKCMNFSTKIQISELTSFLTKWILDKKWATASVWRTKENPRRFPGVFQQMRFLHYMHGVWKSEKKSHSILRAFTYFVDKSSLKSAKNSPFWRFFENLKLAVKQSYQTCQFK